MSHWALLGIIVLIFLLIAWHQSGSRGYTSIGPYFKARWDPPWTSQVPKTCCGGGR